MATNYTLRRKQADRLRLYELSVQDPQFEVELAARKYRQRNGRPARVLREDFCGSAAVACQWVSDHEDNRAIGLDLDQPTLDWATQHNVARLGSAAERVDLRCQDVRNATRPYADIAQDEVCALFDSNEYLEIAAFSTSASDRLAVTVGAAVRVDRQ